MGAKNVVLTGMPGAGKSTVGVLLAKTLGFEFVDTDLIIQRRTGRLLQEIIDTNGIDEFLREEEKAVLSVRGISGAVIATGGSAVYGEAAMKALKENGRVYYLSLPIEEIEKRLVNIKTRGIAMRRGERIQDVYNERRVLYERYADFTVYCDGKTAEDTVHEITEDFLRQGGK